MIPRERPYLTFLFFWIHIVNCTREDAVFLTRPKMEPYYVTEGQEGPIMECSFAPEFRNRTRYEPSWTVVAGDLPRHLTRNGVSFSKQHYELLQTSGAYNLRIRHVVFRRDNGKFFCTVLDKESGAQYTVQANIIVVVEPEKPIITRQPSGAVQEGELVTIECQTTGGNPPPSFLWVFNNRSVVPGEWYHVRSSISPDRPSISILQWRVNAEDNEAYLNCQIRNEAMPKDEHKDASTTRLNVLYGPRVYVGPVYDYNVEEGERVELTCSANSNPAPSHFEWYHVTSGERFAGTTWQFVAERKHSGDFRCTATNSIESGADKLTLNVQYGPIVRAKEWINPAEGDTVILECTVDANPPANSIVWSGPNDIVHEGSTLKIDSIQKTHSGNYTCTAINTLMVRRTKSKSVKRMGQAFTVIDVLRRPGEALVTASSDVIAVGGEATLSCIAVDVGSPEAEYRWLTPSSSGKYKERKTAIYTLEHATLADNGDYRCMPFNRIGDGVEGILTIKVIEPSKIIRPLPESLIFNTGETSVSLKCEAQGYPAPQFQWLKDGQVINERDSSSSHWMVSSEQHPENCPESEFCSITVIGFLNFLQPLAWNDKGNYSCKSSNGLQKFVTSSVALNVLHAPVILNERYPSDALAAADIGSTARIVCHVSARPEPEFEWLRNGSEIHDGQFRYNIRNSRLDGRIDEFQSILEITDSMIYDHGPYICRTSNGNGQKVELVIKLQTKSKPQAPRDLQLISSSPTSLFIGWRPSFDGGKEQSFQLEYRKVNPIKGIPDSTEPVAIYIDGRNASYLTLYEEDATSHRSRRAFSSTVYMVYNISYLNPLSTYWFRVRARNLIGSSDWTPVTTATTTDVRENAAIPRPLTLYYNSAQQKIDFETKQLNDDLCVLLLFASNKNGQDIGSRSEAEELSANWRAMDCFDQTPIYDIPSADYLKARLCHKLNLANCSAASEIIVSSTLLVSGWMYMIPLGAVILLLLFTLCFIIICCRIRRTFNPKKKEKNFAGIERRNDASAPLSQSNTKNTLVHGSQTDSGIFTLGSTPNTNKSNGQPTQGTQGFSTRTGTVADQWNSNVESFTYTNDPYLQEYSTQYQVSPPLHDNKYDGFIDGFPSNDQELNEHRNSIDGPSTIIHDEHDSDETSYTTNGTRRVMREIIV